MPKTLIKRRYRVKHRPLYFRNPFWTTGTLYPPLDTKYTVLDLPPQIDMDSPQFYKSIEARDKALTIQRQLERANAKTLSIRDTLLKQLYEEATKKKEETLYDEMKKQWALAIDESGIPAEFREELADYYKKHPDIWKQKLQNIADFEKAIAEAHKKKTALPKGTVNAPIAMSLGIPPTAGTIKDDKKREAQDKRFAGEEEQSAGKGRFGRGHRRPNVDSLGWRSTPLHRMIRPIYNEIETESPEELVQRQQEEQDDRQASFRADYLARYGVSPSHDTTNRAMPNTVRPLSTTAVKITKYLQTPFNAF